MKYIESIKMEDINLNNKDYLQTKTYSDQLTEVLNNYYKSKSKEPLYIGIIGEWGSGKSTIVKTSISNIDNIKLFEYDAWKYEDDGFRRTFIKSILDQSDISNLSNEYKEINSSLYENYSISSNSIIERIKLSRIKDKKFNTWEAYLIASIIVVVVIITGFVIAENYNSVLGMLFSLLGSIGFFNILYSETIYSKSRLFSPEQFYSTFKKILKKSKGKNNLIFIDNLDRCEGEHLILALKCIRGFYVEKKEKFDEKIVFVIPLDGNSLNSAYNVKDSNHYLDKIFDNIIYLKQITVTDKIDYIHQLLDENIDIKQIVPDSVVEVLVCSNVKTPREIIKMINDYVMQYQIFEKNKGKNFLNDIKNKEYLMKSVILNKKYNSLYRLAFENIKDLVNYERLFFESQEDFDKKYGVECREFLETTTNIVPVNYYSFYSNQNKKAYSLPDDIEEYFDSCNVDLIKEYNNKQQIVNHLSNGIHYYINTSMWKIKIANRFKAFLRLALSNYFSSDEIKQVITSWNKNLFNSQIFYREVVFNKTVGFEELIEFIKIAKPSNNFSQKIIEGIEEKKFSDKEEINYEYYADIYNNNLIDISNEKDKENINKYIKEICEKDLHDNSKYFDFVNTPLIKFVSMENIRLIISKLNYSHADRICSIIDSIENYNIDYNNDFIKTLVSYLNINCSNIKEYSKIEKIFSFILNQEKSTDYINSLSLNFSFEEFDNLSNIENIMNKYIDNKLYNDTFRSFIYSFKNKSNINHVFNGFDNALQTMEQTFLNCYVKYVTEVNIDSFRSNIEKIVNLYEKYDNKSQLILNFKNRKVLKNIYDSISSSSNKENYVISVLNTQLTFEEKIDNIFLYESDPDRFKNFIDNEFSLTNALMIVKNIEKKSNINQTVDRIVSLIEDKDNILQKEFDEIFEILNLSYIDKNSTKKIIKSIIYKIDIDCVNKIRNLIEITDERIIKMIDERIGVKEV